MNIENNIILEVKDISLKLNDFQILDKVSLQVKKGEITTLIGPNGSGKTSFIKIILGLLKPSKGVIKIAPQIKIGYMPQTISFDHNIPLTVKDFLELQYKDIKKNKDFLTLSNELGVNKILTTQMHSISGGERQRVLLLKALLGQPDLLVLDEPVQGLDVQGQVEFYKLIDKVRLERNISIFMVSHDLYMVMKSTDHVFCLNKHICCEGNPEDVSKHPSYIKLFGQEAARTMGIYSHHHDHTHG
jgi:zinc transport system ATP-binding protein